MCRGHGIVVKSGQVTSLPVDPPVLPPSPESGERKREREKKEFLWYNIFSMMMVA